MARAGHGSHALERSIQDPGGLKRFCLSSAHTSRMFSRLLARAVERRVRATVPADARIRHGHVRHRAGRGRLRAERRRPARERRGRDRWGARKRRASRRGWRSLLCWRCRGARASIRSTRSCTWTRGTRWTCLRPLQSRSVSLMCTLLWMRSQYRLDRRIMVAERMGTVLERRERKGSVAPESRRLSILGDRDCMRGTTAGVAGVTAWVAVTTTKSR